MATPTLTVTRRPSPPRAAAAALRRRSAICSAPSRRGFGQEDGEEVAAETGHAIDGAPFRVQEGAQTDEELVAALPSGHLVEGPEVIHVDEEKGEIAAVALAPGELPLETSAEGSLVGQSRELVLLRRPLHPAAELVHLENEGEMVHEGREETRVPSLVEISVEGDHDDPAERPARRGAQGHGNARGRPLPVDATGRIEFGQSPLVHEGARSDEESGGPGLLDEQGTESRAVPGIAGRRREDDEMGALPPLMDHPAHVEGKDLVKQDEELAQQFRSAEAHANPPAHLAETLEAPTIADGSVLFAEGGCAPKRSLGTPSCSRLASKVPGGDQRQVVVELVALGEGAHPIDEGFDEALGFRLDPVEKMGSQIGETEPFPVGIARIVRPVGEEEEQILGLQADAASRIGEVFLNSQGGCPRCAAP